MIQCWQGVYFQNDRLTDIKTLQEVLEQLDDQLEKLKILENKHFKQLELFMQTSEQLAAIKEKRQQQEIQAIRCRFEEYRQWIKEANFHFYSYSL